MKMATYTGMSLRGEVRESISLDEDDLSDVEDEVFIRDGKNGYKLAEELNVKRPLMAPRRKAGKPDKSTRLRNRPHCKALCKPCCYVFMALSVLIGLIVLVVVLVSMYPLPLDSLRDWVIKKSYREDAILKLLPCNDLKITDIWSVNLPKLTTDSPVRVLDVNEDGIEDILFGFGTGNNYDILPPDLFCPIFMGVPPPCEGGIIALDGVTGDIIWRHWFNDTIFSLQCTADVNGDTVNDCLAVGIAGTIAVVNSKNGTVIWQLNTGRTNVFVGNFIPDQNNDNVPDILASHSSLSTESDGHIVLFSGKNGEELSKLRTPDNAKTFYMPQVLNQSTSMYFLFGTGSPSTPGNLSISPASDIMSGKLSNRTKMIYQDKFKGILTQSVLVDITGDKIPDIVTAMYNSSLIAINGKTFEQIWNYTIPGPNSETNITPTPAYFNFDNVTDFLIIYQKYDDILNYNYTQSFIIDGKTGESIYSPISGSMITQMSGLTVSMESYGYDMYLFWSSECTNVEMFKKVDMPAGKFGDPYDDCRRLFNTTSILKLNALGQFHQPPGFVIYNSVDRTAVEFNNTKSTTRQLREYYGAHPKIHIESPGQTEVDEKYKVDPVPIGIRKYGSSSFRHKDHKFMDAPENGNPLIDEEDPQITNQDYDWSQNQPSTMLNGADKLEPDFNDYPIDETIPYNQKHLLLNKHLQNSKNSNRDPRSKEKKVNVSSKKKNLSDRKNRIDDYKNVRLSKDRLFHDVDHVATDILKDTFVKNEERRLKKSKFEQRDVNEHTDKIKEKQEIQKMIQEELDAMKNNSMSLWDLESEKERNDWAGDSYRGKREVNYTIDSTTKITSVGAIVNQLNSFNMTNSIDIVFITYWQPTMIQERDLLKQDIQDCVEDKLLKHSKDQSHDYQKTTDKEQRELFKRECSEEQANLQNDFSYFDKLHQLRLGQMTVYRLRIECECATAKNNGRCARFLPKRDQSWPSYLGKFGDGVFLERG